MTDDTYFEILTRCGSRFRYPLAEYSWCYGPVAGTIDTEARSVVEVTRHNSDGGLPDDDFKITYSPVIAVGSVSPETCLVSPRERMYKACPRCSYREEIDFDE